jgi:FixJ family two-component response regulator
VPADSFVIGIIDDDEAMQLSLADLLRSYEYRTLVFSSAEAFLAADSDVDCVIADVQMAGLSGIQLKYRLIEQCRDRPFVLITASSDPTLDAAARACGAIALLRKPFATERLMGCLDRALRDKQRSH